MGVKEVNIGLNAGVLNISGKWEPNEKELQAAWELYVELSTRITTQKLEDDEGILREALNSLYSFFQISREILKKYGPEIARPSNDNDLTLGYITISILNYEVRPFLAKWHPLLKDFEDKKPKEETSVTYEKTWKHYCKCRKELEFTRRTLSDYAKTLSEKLKIPNIHLIEKANSFVEPQ